VGTVEVMLSEHKKDFEQKLYDVDIKLNTLIDAVAKLAPQN
jgi:hypothetical protein